MEFIREEFYQSEKVMEQFACKGELSIITKNKHNGNYTLWQKDKNIAEDKSVINLHKKIKGYYDK